MRRIDPTSLWTWLGSRASIVLALVLFDGIYCVTVIAIAISIAGFVSKLPAQTAPATRVANETVSSDNDDILSAADLAMRGNHFKEAVDLYIRAANNNPRSAEIHLNLGRALHGRGQTDPQSFYDERAAYQRALKIDPNCLPALNALVDWYRTFLPLAPNVPWYREAIAYARRASVLSPTDIHAASIPDLLVIQQWAAGMLSDEKPVEYAVNDLRVLLARDPTDAELPFSIARAKVEQARRRQQTLTDGAQLPEVTQLYSESIQDFERLVGKNNNGPQAGNALMHARFGELLEYLAGNDFSAPENRGNYLDRAAIELERGRNLIEQNEPGYAWVNQYSAAFAERRGDYKAAIRIYRSMQDTPVNRRDLALALSSDPQTRPEAERLIEQIMPALEDDAVHPAGARVTLQAQLTDMHVSDYTEATDPAVKDRLAASIQSDLDKLNSAVDIRNPLELRRCEAHFQMVTQRYQELIDHLTLLSKKDSFVRKDEALQFMLASSHAHLHQTSGALDVLKALVELYPRDVRARKEYVRLLLGENASLAEMQLKELEQIDAGDPDLQIYRIGTGQLQQADFAAMPESNPIEIHRKALAALHLKNWDESHRLFSRLVEIDPKDDNSWNNLVKVLMTQGKNNEALDTANKGLALHPEDGQLKILIDGIKSNDPNIPIKLMKEAERINPDKHSGTRPATTIP
jgi:tetratricopeptide (TPR) repeat protein